MQANSLGKQLRLWPDAYSSRLNNSRSRLQAPGPAAVSQSPAREKPAPIAFNKDDFKNDPLIQKALEIFKGQIVEVRV